MNTREVLNISKEGKVTIVEDATVTELRQVITMLANLYYEQVVVPKRAAADKGIST